MLRKNTETYDVWLVLFSVLRRSRFDKCVQFNVNRATKYSGSHRKYKNVKRNPSRMWKRNKSNIISVDDILCFLYLRFRRLLKEMQRNCIFEQEGSLPFSKNWNLMHGNMQGPACHSCSLVGWVQASNNKDEASFSNAYFNLSSFSHCQFA